MIKKEIIEKIKKEAQRFFKDAKGCHDWLHVERVHNLALAISKKEKSRKDILEVAAYLHDIGRQEEMKSQGKFCHAEYGSELAREILETLYNFPLTEISDKLYPPDMSPLMSKSNLLALQTRCCCSF